MGWTGGILSVVSRQSLVDSRSLQSQSVSRQSFNPHGSGRTTSRLPLLHRRLATAALGAAQQTSPLEAQVRALIAASGAEIAVAARSVDGRFELLIDPDKPFHAASTMKVPVMIELYRQAKAGTVSLDAPLPIRNEFRSIVDGSPYKLSEGDDSDTPRLRGRRQNADARGSSTKR